MIFVQLSNGMRAAIDEIDAESVLKKTWHFDRNYAVHTTSRKGTPIKLYMHSLILPAPAGFHVDHVDGDGLNNTRANLRIATPTQNMANAKLHGRNRSGSRGVSWDSWTGKWRARLICAGLDLSLGRFDSVEEARNAYVTAANKHFGEYALHNRKP